MASSDPPEFSIVMPCLNESRTLRACIEKARQCLEAQHLNGEIIVSDNGSSDDSVQIASDIGARVVHAAEKGYGSALSAGIAAARGQFVIMGDCDGSYDFANLQPFIEKLRGGFDLVMGNRFAGGIAPGAMPFLHQYLGNPLLSGLGRLFFGNACRDMHCGLRGFRKEAIMQLDLRTTGMEFASEMVVKAALRGLRIAEVPTTLSPDGRNCPPHLRTWRDGWRHLRFLLLYSPRWLFLYPGLLLMIAGLLASLWLLPHARQIGRVELDVHTLLYAGFAILIGFQAVSFAAFTKIFAIRQGLLPSDPRIESFLARIKLEFGLLAGTLLILLGLIGSFAAVASWGEKSFGHLNPTRELRLVIPSVTCLALGCQIILNSFFLSVLGLPRRGS